MLFKNYIYINEELLQKLAKQLEIQISYDIIKTNQINKKAGVDFSKFTAGAENIQTDTENLKNDKYDLMRIFEKRVMEDEMGIITFDFDVADHIFSGQLIQFTARIMQPKGEDENIELINSIKKNPLFAEIIKDSVDKSKLSDQKILDLIFKINNNIPVYFSRDERYIVVSSMNTEGLDITYEDFQELYGEEVKVILLVDRKYSEEQDVVLMDAMKDIFHMGRDLRRAMPKHEQEKYLVKEKGPAIKGEILAIYN